MTKELLKSQEKTENKIKDMKKLKSDILMNIENQDFKDQTFIDELKELFSKNIAPLNVQDEI